MRMRPGDPLMQKRRKRAPIGYEVTYHYCLDCVPEGIELAQEPLRAGDDAGRPYQCDDCGRDLVPSDP